MDRPSLTNHRVMFGVALLCVVGVIAWLVSVIGGDGTAAPTPLPPSPTPTPTATVTATPSPAPLTDLKGLGCGTKTNMLDNPEVKDILKNKYGIGSVNCPGDGSITICNNKDGIKDLDFVWPASLYAVDLCQQTLGHNLEYEVSFHSPIVFYSWDCVTDELVKRGQVRQTDGVYYIPDMVSFTQVILQGPPWRNICGLASRLRVIPTDPTKSNSGSEFVALLAAMQLNGEVPTEKTVQPLLPVLKEYIEILGGLERTSSKLFANCIHTAMGACPIFAVYEAQGIDFIKQNPGDQEAILKKFRILYPQPTVWAAHELIVISPRGKLMLDAMKDKQIQQIAWKNHGFRTGSLGNPNNPKDLGFDGIPDSITSVVGLPKPAVMDIITKYLSPPAGTPAAPKP